MNRKLYPATQINTIYDLTPEWLKSRGVKAVLCDLDDTLTPYYDTTPNDRIAEWIRTMEANGIRLCILTNGKKHRVLPFCRDLGVECVPMAMKPLPFGYFRALRRMQVKRREAVAVGDHDFIACSDQVHDGFGGLGDQLELLSGGIAQCVAAQRDNDSLRHNALPHCFRFSISACPF